MSKSVAVWGEKHPQLAQRGIDESTWNALTSSVYPGAKPESIVMAIDYCRARQFDILLKPVHIVPMQVKTGRDYVWRDVVMPGIGLYRIQADRSGTYAGADEPEFGPDITRIFKDGERDVEVTFPQWCKMTVYKLVNGQRVAFTSKEYWLENYATAGKGSTAPNSMWKKRPYAQLGKCVEAQCLRKAWPEIGSEATADEMHGKVIELDAAEVEVTRPVPQARTEDKPRAATTETTAAQSQPADAPREVEGELVQEECIKPNHVRMITTKLARANQDDAGLLQLLQVDHIESIPLAKLNQAMDYVNNLGKQG